MADAQSTSHPKPPSRRKLRWLVLTICIGGVLLIAGAAKIYQVCSRQTTPIDSASRPTEWAQPIDKPGHSTVITLEEIHFDRKLADSIFTQSNLKRSEAAR